MKSSPGPLLTFAHSYSRRARKVLTAALLLPPLALASPASAQETIFPSNTCDEDQRADIEAAHEALYERIDVVWDDIETAIEGANIHGYVEIGAGGREKFESSIEKLRFECDWATVCELTGGITGYVGPWSDLLVLCTNHIEAVQANNELASPVAAIGTSIAYLAASQITLFGSGASSADTISRAVGNRLMTPEFEVEIQYVRQESSVGLAVLVVGLEVRNTNPYSASPDKKVATAGDRDWVPNPSVYVGLDYGGADPYLPWVSLEPAEVYETQLILWEKDNYLLMEPSGYDPTAAEVPITVTIDHGDEVREIDESDNSDTVVFSPYVDLAITRFELTGPYETQPSGGPKGPGLGAARTMFRRISWNVDVENRSSSNDAQITRSEWEAPSSVDGRVEPSTELEWMSSLQPGETVTFQVEALVPVRANTDEVIGAWPIRLEVDSTHLVLDPDRSNNVVEFVIDEAWFRPDYVAVFDRIDLLESGKVTVGGVVRNEGPEPGGKSLVAFTSWDSSTQTAAIPGLGVLEERPFQFLADQVSETEVFVQGKDYELLLTADHGGTIFENNETNNEASAKFHRSPAIGVILAELFDTTLDPDSLRPIETDHYSWLEQALGWTETDLRERDWTDFGGPGPIMRTPEEVLVGRTELGPVALFVDQWLDRDVELFVWPAKDVHVFEALRIGPALLESVPPRRR